MPAFFAGRTKELESAILKELGRLGIKTDPFRYDRDRSTRAIQTIYIPVRETPTASSAPPDVNMSQMRGCLVLRDLLSYQRVHGRYEFTADDLIQRLAGVTEEKMAACTASLVKGAEGVRRTPSAVSMKAVRRCLDEVKQFGLWVQRRGYQKLAAI